jgi:type III restriction enzyme
MSKPKFRHQLSSGNGRTSNVFFELEKPVPLDEGTKSEGIRIPDIQKHVVRYALSRNPFYYFDNLSRYFPNIASIWDFIEDEKYLGGMEIIFYGTPNRLQEISHFDYLQALNGLLQTIEADIKHNAPDYEGSSFQAQPIRQVFRDKESELKKEVQKQMGRNM